MAVLFAVAVALALGTLEHRFRLARGRQRHDRRVARLALSRDGRLVASASPGLHEDGPSAIKLWELSSRLDLVLGPRRAKASIDAIRDPIVSMAFATDDRLLVAGDSGTLLVIDPVSGSIAAAFSASGGIYEVACSPREAALAAVVPDSGDAVQLWDLDRRVVVRTLAPKARLYDAAFTPDGGAILAVGENYVALWELASGQEVARLAPGPGTVTELAIGEDGRLAIIGSPRDDFVAVVDLPGLASLRRLELGEFKSGDWSTFGVALVGGAALAGGAPEPQSDGALGIRIGSGLGVARVERIAGDPITCFVPTREPDLVLVGTRSGAVHCLELSGKK